MRKSKDTLLKTVGILMLISGMATGLSAHILSVTGKLYGDQTSLKNDKINRAMETLTGVKQARADVPPSSGGDGGGASCAGCGCGDSCSCGGSGGASCGAGS